MYTQAKWAQQVALLADYLLLAAMWWTSKSSLRYGRAPEMTPVSYPNKNPAGQSLGWCHFHGKLAGMPGLLDEQNIFITSNASECGQKNNVVAQHRPKIIVSQSGASRSKLDRRAHSVPDLQRVIVHRDSSVAEQRVFIGI